MVKMINIIEALSLWCIVSIYTILPLMMICIVWYGKINCDKFINRLVSTSSNQYLPVLTGFISTGSSSSSGKIKHYRILVLAVPVPVLRVLRNCRTSSSSSSAPFGYKTGTVLNFRTLNESVWVHVDMAMRLLPEHQFQWRYCTIDEIVQRCHKIVRVVVC